MTAQSFLLSRQDFHADQLSCNWSFPQTVFRCRHSFLLTVFPICIQLLSPCRQFSSNRTYPRYLADFIPCVESFYLFNSDRQTVFHSCPCMCYSCWVTSPSILSIDLLKVTGTFNLCLATETWLPSDKSLLCLICWRMILCWFLG